MSRKRATETANSTAPDSVSLDILDTCIPWDCFKNFRRRMRRCGCNGTGCSNARFCGLFSLCQRRTGQIPVQPSQDQRMHQGCSADPPLASHRTTACKVKPNVGSACLSKEVSKTSSTTHDASSGRCLNPIGQQKTRMDSIVSLSTRASTLLKTKMRSTDPNTVVFFQGCCGYATFRYDCCTGHPYLSRCQSRSDSLLSAKNEYDIVFFKGNCGYAAFDSTCCRLRQTWWYNMQPTYPSPLEESLREAGTSLEELTRSTTRIHKPDTDDSTIQTPTQSTLPQTDKMVQEERNKTRVTGKLTDSITTCSSLKHLQQRRCHCGESSIGEHTTVDDVGVINRQREENGVGANYGNNSVDDIEGIEAHSKLKICSRHSSQIQELINLSKSEVHDIDTSGVGVESSADMNNYRKPHDFTKCEHTIKSGLPKQNSYKSGSNSERELQLHQPPADDTDAHVVLLRMSSGFDCDIPDFHQQLGSNTNCNRKSSVNGVSMDMSADPPEAVNSDVGQSLLALLADGDYITSVLPRDVKNTARNLDLEGEICKRSSTCQSDVVSHAPGNVSCEVGDEYFAEKVQFHQTTDYTSTREPEGYETPVDFTAYNVEIVASTHYVKEHHVDKSTEEMLNPDKCEILVYDEVIHAQEVELPIRLDKPAGMNETCSSHPSNKKAIGAAIGAVDAIDASRKMGKESNDSMDMPMTFANKRQREDRSPIKKQPISVELTPIQQESRSSIDKRDILAEATAIPKRISSGCKSGRKDDQHGAVGSTLVHENGSVIKPIPSETIPRKHTETSIVESKCMAFQTTPLQQETIRMVDQQHASANSKHIQQEESNRVVSKFKNPENRSVVDKQHSSFEIKVDRSEVNKQHVSVKETPMSSTNKNVSETHPISPKHSMRDKQHISVEELRKPIINKNVFETHPISPKPSMREKQHVSVEETTKPLINQNVLEPHPITPEITMVGKQDVSVEKITIQEEERGKITKQHSSIELAPVQQENRSVLKSHAVRSETTSVPQENGSVVTKQHVSIQLAPIQQANGCVLETRAVKSETTPVRQEDISVVTKQQASMELAQIQPENRCVLETHAVQSKTTTVRQQYPSSVVKQYVSVESTPIQQVGRTDVENHPIQLVTTSTEQDRIGENKQKHDSVETPPIQQGLRTVVETQPITDKITPIHNEHRGRGGVNEHRGGVNEQHDTFGATAIQQNSRSIVDNQPVSAADTQVQMQSKCVLNENNVSVEKIIEQKCRHVLNHQPISDKTTPSLQGKQPMSLEATLIQQEVKHFVDNKHILFQNTPIQQGNSVVGGHIIRVKTLPNEEEEIHVVAKRRTSVETPPVPQIGRNIIENKPKPFETINMQGHMNEVDAQHIIIQTTPRQQELGVVETQRVSTETTCAHPEQEHKRQENQKHRHETTPIQQQNRKKLVNQPKSFEHAPGCPKHKHTAVTEKCVIPEIKEDDPVDLKGQMQQQVPRASAELQRETSKLSKSKDRRSVASKPGLELGNPAPQKHHSLFNDVLGGKGITYRKGSNQCDKHVEVNVDPNERSVKNSKANGSETQTPSSISTDASSHDRTGRKFQHLQTTSKCDLQPGHDTVNRKLKYKNPRKSYSKGATPKATDESNATKNGTRNGPANEAPNTSTKEPTKCHSRIAGSKSVNSRNVKKKTRNNVSKQTAIKKATTSSDDDKYSSGQNWNRIVLDDTDCIETGDDQTVFQYISLPKCHEDSSGETSTLLSCPDNVSNAEVHIEDASNANLTNTVTSSMSGNQVARKPQTQNKFGVIDDDVFSFFEEKRPPTTEGTTNGSKYTQSESINTDPITTRTTDKDGVKNNGGDTISASDSLISSSDSNTNLKHNDTPLTKTTIPSSRESNCDQIRDSMTMDVGSTVSIDTKCTQALTPQADTMEGDIKSTTRQSAVKNPSGKYHRKLRPIISQSYKPLRSQSDFEADNTSSSSRTASQKKLPKERHSGLKKDHVSSSIVKIDTSVNKAKSKCGHGVSKNKTSDIDTNRTKKTEIQKLNSKERTSTGLAQLPGGKTNKRGQQVKRSRLKGSGKERKSDVTEKLQREDPPVCVQKNTDKQNGNAQCRPILVADTRNYSPSDSVQKFEMTIENINSVLPCTRGQSNLDEIEDSCKYVPKTKTVHDQEATSEESESKKTRCQTQASDAADSSINDVKIVANILPTSDEGKYRNREVNTADITTCHACIAEDLFEFFDNPSCPSGNSPNPIGTQEEISSTTNRGEPNGISNMKDQNEEDAGNSSILRGIEEPDVACNNDNGTVGLEHTVRKSQEETIGDALHQALTLDCDTCETIASSLLGLNYDNDDGKTNMHINESEAPHNLNKVQNDDDTSQEIESQLEQPQNIIFYTESPQTEDDMTLCSSAPHKQICSSYPRLSNTAKRSNSHVELSNTVEAESTLVPEIGVREESTTEVKAVVARQRNRDLTRNNPADMGSTNQCSEDGGLSENRNVIVHVEEEAAAIDITAERHTSYRYLAESEYKEKRCEECQVEIPEKGQLTDINSEHGSKLQERSNHSVNACMYVENQRQGTGFIEQNCATHSTIISDCALGDTSKPLPSGYAQGCAIDVHNGLNNTYPQHAHGDILQNVTRIPPGHYGLIGEEQSTENGLHAPRKVPAKEAVDEPTTRCVSGQESQSVEKTISNITREKDTSSDLDKSEIARISGDFGNEHSPVPEGQPATICVLENNVNVPVSESVKNINVDGRCDVKFTSEESTSSASTSAEKQINSQNKYDRDRTPILVEKNVKRKLKHLDSIKADMVYLKSICETMRKNLSGSIVEKSTEKTSGVKDKHLEIDDNEAVLNSLAITRKKHETTTHIKDPESLSDKIQRWQQIRLKSKAIEVFMSNVNVKPPQKDTPAISEDKDIDKPMHEDDMDQALSSNCISSNGDGKSEAYDFQARNVHSFKERDTGCDTRDQAVIDVISPEVDSVHIPATTTNRNENVYSNTMHDQNSTTLVSTQSTCNHELNEDLLEEAKDRNSTQDKRVAKKQVKAQSDKCGAGNHGKKLNECSENYITEPQWGVTSGQGDEETSIFRTDLLQPNLHEISDGSGLLKNGYNVKGEVITNLMYEADGVSGPETAELFAEDEQTLEEDNRSPLQLVCLVQRSSSLEDGSIGEVEKHETKLPVTLSMPIKAASSCNNTFPRDFCATVKKGRACLKTEKVRVIPNNPQCCDIQPSISNGNEQTCTLNSCEPVSKQEAANLALMSADGTADGNIKCDRSTIRKHVKSQQEHLESTDTNDVVLCEKTGENIKMDITVEVMNNGIYAMGQKQATNFNAVKCKTKTIVPGSRGYITEEVLQVSTSPNPDNIDETTANYDQPDTESVKSKRKAINCQIDIQDIQNDHHPIENDISDGVPSHINNGKRPRNMCESLKKVLAGEVMKKVKTKVNNKQKNKDKFKSKRNDRKVISEGDPLKPPQVTDCEQENNTAYIQFESTDRISDSLWDGDDAWSPRGSNRPQRRVIRNNTPFTKPEHYHTYLDPIGDETRKDSGISKLILAANDSPSTELGSKQVKEEGSQSKDPSQIETKMSSANKNQTNIPMSINKHVPCGGVIGPSIERTEHPTLLETDDNKASTDEVVKAAEVIGESEIPPAGLNKMKKCMGSRKQKKAKPDGRDKVLTCSTKAKTLPTILNTSVGKSDLHKNEKLELNCEPVNKVTDTQHKHSIEVSPMCKSQTEIDNTFIDEAQVQIVQHSDTYQTRTSSSNTSADGEGASDQKHLDFIGRWNKNILSCNPHTAVPTDGNKCDGEPRRKESTTGLTNWATIREHLNMGGHLKDTSACTMDEQQVDNTAGYQDIDDEQMRNTKQSKRKKVKKIKPKTSTEKTSDKLDIPKESKLNDHFEINNMNLDEDQLQSADHADPHARLACLHVSGDVEMRRPECTKSSRYWSMVSEHVTDSPACIVDGESVLQVCITDDKKDRGDGHIIYKKQSKKKMKKKRRKTSTEKAIETFEPEKESKLDENVETEHINCDEEHSIKVDHPDTPVGLEYLNASAGSTREQESTKGPTHWVTVREHVKIGNHLIDSSTCNMDRETAQKVCITEDKQYINEGNKKQRKSRKLKKRKPKTSSDKTNDTFQIHIETNLNENFEITNKDCDEEQCQRVDHSEEQIQRVDHSNTYTNRSETLDASSDGDRLSTDKQIEFIRNWKKKTLTSNRNTAGSTRGNSCNSEQHSSTMTGRPGSTTECQTRWDKARQHFKMDDNLSNLTDCPNGEGTEQETCVIAEKPDRDRGQVIGKKNTKCRKLKKRKPKISTEKINENACPHNEAHLTLQRLETPIDLDYERDRSMGKSNIQRTEDENVNGIDDNGCGVTIAHSDTVPAGKSTTADSVDDMESKPKWLLGENDTGSLNTPVFLQELLDTPDVVSESPEDSGKGGTQPTRNQFLANEVCEISREGELTHAEANSPSAKKEHSNKKKNYGERSRTVKNKKSNGKLKPNKSSNADNTTSNLQTSPIVDNISTLLESTPTYELITEIHAIESMDGSKTQPIGDFKSKSSYVKENGDSKDTYLEIRNELLINDTEKRDMDGSGTLSDCQNSTNFGIENINQIQRVHDSDAATGLNYVNVSSGSVRVSEERQLAFIRRWKRNSLSIHRNTAEAAGSIDCIAESSTIRGPGSTTNPNPTYWDKASQHFNLREHLSDQHACTMKGESVQRVCTTDEKEIIDGGGHMVSKKHTKLRKSKKRKPKTSIDITRQHSDLQMESNMKVNYEIEDLNYCEENTQNVDHSDIQTGLDYLDLSSDGEGVNKQRQIIFKRSEEKDNINANTRASSGGNRYDGEPLSTRRHDSSHSGTYWEKASQYLNDPQSCIMDEEGVPGQCTTVEQYDRVESQPICKKATKHRYLKKNKSKQSACIAIAHLNVHDHTHSDINSPEDVTSPEICFNNDTVDTTTNTNNQNIQSVSEERKENDLDVINSATNLSQTQERNSLDVDTIITSTVQTNETGYEDTSTRRHHVESNAIEMSYHQDLDRIYDDGSCLEDLTISGGANCTHTLTDHSSGANNKHRLTKTGRNLAYLSKLQPILQSFTGKGGRYREDIIRQSTNVLSSAITKGEESNIPREQGQHHATVSRKLNDTISRRRMNSQSIVSRYNSIKNNSSIRSCTLGNTSKLLTRKLQHTHENTCMQEPKYKLNMLNANLTDSRRTGTQTLLHDQYDKWSRCDRKEDKPKDSVVTTAISNKMLSRQQTYSSLNTGDLETPANSHKCTATYIRSSKAPPIDSKQHSHRSELLNTKHMNYVEDDTHGETTAAQDCPAQIVDCVSTEKINSRTETLSLTGGCTNVANSSDEDSRRQSSIAPVPGGRRYLQETPRSEGRQRNCNDTEYLSSGIFESIQDIDFSQEAELFSNQLSIVNGTHEIETFPDGRCLDAYIYSIAKGISFTSPRHCDTEDLLVYNTCDLPSSSLYSCHGDQPSSSDKLTADNHDETSSTNSVPFVLPCSEPVNYSKARSEILDRKPRFDNTHDLVTDHVAYNLSNDSDYARECTYIGNSPDTERKRREYGSSLTQTGTVSTLDTRNFEDIKAEDNTVKHKSTAVHTTYGSASENRFDLSCRNRHPNRDTFEPGVHSDFTLFRAITEETDEQLRDISSRRLRRGKCSSDDSLETEVRNKALQRRKGFVEFTDTNGIHRDGKKKRGRKRKQNKLLPASTTHITHLRSIEQPPKVRRNKLALRESSIPRHRSIEGCRRPIHGGLPSTSYKAEKRIPLTGNETKCCDKENLDILVLDESGTEREILKGNTQLHVQEAIQYTDFELPWQDYSTQDTADTDTTHTDDNSIDCFQTYSVFKFNGSESRNMSQKRPTTSALKSHNGVKLKKTVRFNKDAINKKRYQDVSKPVHPSQRNSTVVKKLPIGVSKPPGRYKADDKVSTTPAKLTVRYRTDDKLSAAGTKPTSVSAGKHVMRNKPITGSSIKAADRQTSRFAPPGNSDPVKGRGIPLKKAPLKLKPTPVSYADRRRFRDMEEVSSEESDEDPDERIHIATKHSEEGANTDKHEREEDTSSIFDRPTDPPAKETTATDMEYVAMVAEGDISFIKDLEGWRDTYNLDANDIEADALKLLTGDFTSLYDDLPEVDRLAVTKQIERLDSMTNDDLMNM